MKSPITNCYHLMDQAKRLDVKRQMLYEPVPSRDWMYSHHPFITNYQGKYFAIWSNGLINEDDVAQRIFRSQSHDGINWSTPSALIDSKPGRDSDLVLSAAGFHQYNDELMAYYYQYEYTPESLGDDGHRKPRDAGHLETGLYVIRSKDSENWSDPIDTGLKVGPNFGPQKTHSGRLITSVSFSYPYTDDPYGITGWTLSGVYPKELEGKLIDDSEGIHLIKNLLNWDSIVCEGSFYQTDDDVIHMMLRTNEKHLKVTESHDDGQTWSEPQWTDFTDNATKFHFGRLPDGRFYYIGSPDPEPCWGRPRLILSLSNNGIEFSQHYIVADEPFQQKQKGMHKHGEYGYPHSLVHNDRMHIICSRQKEAIEVINFDLKELG